MTKKTSKKVKKVAKKKVAAASGLDSLAGAAKEIAELETGLEVQRQKSNLAILHDKIKILVLFGTKEKLKVRSRFFKDGERDVRNRTLLLKAPSNSQILSTSRLLIQRALKEVKE